MLISDNLITVIKRFIIPSYKRVMGIDITGSSIQIVELSLHNKKTVLTAFVKEQLMDELGSHLLSSIQTMITHWGVKSKAAIIAIEDSNVFIKKLILPNLSETEIEEAVKWEIDQLNPFETGTYYYDFFILNKERNAKTTTVLAVAAYKAIIDRIVQIMKEMNINILAIESTSFSLARIISNPDCLFMDVKENIIKIIVFHQHIPSKITTVNHDSTEQVVNAVMQSMEWCKMQESLIEPHTIYINGDILTIDFLENLKLHTNLLVEKIDCFKDIDCIDSIDKRHIEKFSAEILTAISAAKRGFDV
ncbi:type IV pilus biogenesis protein PilM [Anaerosinus massiliensis]|uniref:type IV pilus biogenesis protein PilM n=1 Tax=Massilibacillus massiliensis TaxID=1806837 RepID=UPI000DA63964|nr:pilus assembly protein PilM [Massilibacillus massiliensis]